MRLMSSVWFLAFGLLDCGSMFLLLIETQYGTCGCTPTHIRAVLMDDDLSDCWISIADASANVNVNANVIFGLVSDIRYDLRIIQIICHLICPACHNYTLAFPLQTTVICRTDWHTYTHSDLLTVFEVLFVVCRWCHAMIYQRWLIDWQKTSLSSVSLPAVQNL